ncbi:protein translocase subunit SecF [Litorivicinus lipolyticus]|uniref:Protein-export membrane protein SecF n=1 Tax=Litorivicinus lipolyticus TaxID=418701 RepID=A0A5Q2QCI4_9GAMM|nr:protein translocase subunit SecF [Litorivicinus lipolyticus]QGG79707.1 protein translocase subunit SecF [Litorivicinus lipolyticus]
MKTLSIDFMGQRKVAGILSIVVLLVSLGSIATKGLSFGLDFTGGALVEVEYERPADLEATRTLLVGAGFPDPVVQNFGTDTDVLIRLQQDNSATLGDEIVRTLNDAGLNVTLLRSEFVGAQVGDELRDQGGLGLLLALLVVMAYVALRFQIKFSVGAVSALAHDVIIVIGVFSLLGWDFDLTVLAAVLAVIGYSLNDTIVVSDRIRENFRTVRNGDSLSIINLSINQTLGRTLVTSLTTALVLICLLVLGGELIRGFSAALLIGVAVGTYSSIYVAANALILMNISRDDLIPKAVDDGDEMP